jgi:hypothetical protein
MTHDQPDAPPPVNVNFRRRDVGLADGWVTLEGELDSPTGWKLVILASALERHAQDLEDYATSLQVSFQVSAHEEPEVEPFPWAEPTIATAILLAEALQEDPDSPHILLQTYVPSDEGIDVTVTLLADAPASSKPVDWIRPAGPGKVTLIVTNGEAKLATGYGGPYFAQVGNPAKEKSTNGTCSVTATRLPCTYRCEGGWKKKPK